MRHTPTTLAALDRAFDGLSITGKAVVATAYIISTANIAGTCSCAELRGTLGLSEDVFETVYAELHEAGVAYRIDEDELSVGLTYDLMVFAVGAPGRPRAKDWDALKARLFSIWFEHIPPQCMYCNAEGVPLTLDHAQPVSRGGSNHPLNFIAACHPCNSSKRDKTFQEFMVWRKAQGL